MSIDIPTHSEVGEENVRQYLRRRNEEYVLYGRYPAPVRREGDEG